VADFLVNNGISRAENIRVIYAPAAPMERAPAIADPVLGMMGSLIPIKGVDVLLRALPRIAQQYPDVRCRVAGDGPLRDSLGHLAAELGVANHVEWLGRVAEPSTFFRTLQIYVQPSRSETFGQAALEAMSAGVPVIGSRAGALPEVIEEGINGVLFATDDHEELAHRVIQLLADPAERARLAAAGVRHAARFTPERMGAEHRKLYAELAESRGSGTGPVARKHFRGDSARSA
jgi:phosphatidylinositol alpha-mannosyltransferase